MVIHLQNSITEGKFLASQYQGQHNNFIEKLKDEILHLQPLKLKVTKTCKEDHKFIPIETATLMDWSDAQGSRSLLQHDAFVILNQAVRKKDSCHNTLETSPAAHSCEI